jgi:hypothetical protein
MFQVIRESQLEADRSNLITKEIGKMKSTSILGRASNLAISGAMVCLLMFTACGNRAGTQMESQNAGTEAAARNDGRASASTSATPASSSAPATDKVTPGTQTRINQSSQVSSGPSPQIGTGGSDFFLFTQARAALDADVELKAANVVIDVKAGSMTLNGTVSNAEQKAKAEQLVRAVAGVKAVRNQLRIVEKQGTLPRV